jgi:hypothetical protein
MKVFQIAAWVSGILAFLIILTAALSLFVGTLFGIRHVVNYFHAANSLLLLAILCVLARQGCIDKKS